jgi:hypothetical protein
MEIDADSDTDSDSSLDVKSISAAPIETQSARVAQPRMKEVVDLRADVNEQQHGLFRHFTVISWDEHLEELRKTSV